MFTNVSTKQLVLHIFFIKPANKQPRNPATLQPRNPATPANSLNRNLANLEILKKKYQQINYIQVTCSFSVTASNHISALIQMQQLIQNLCYHLLLRIYHYVQSMLDSPYYYYTPSNSMILDVQKITKDQRPNNRQATSKTVKSNFLQKFLFNQSYVKPVAQKFIKSSYILQNKFKNDLLLKEEYINDFCFKINNKSKLQSVIPIINLNNKIIQIWEIIKLVIYLYFMWMMPFKGVFDSYEGPYIHEIILYYFIILNIGLLFNKEIILEGLLINDRSIIFLQFMKNNFFLAYLSVFIHMYNIFILRGKNSLTHEYWIIFFQFKEVLIMYLELLREFNNHK